MKYRIKNYFRRKFYYGNHFPWLQIKIVWDFITNEPKNLEEYIKRHGRAKG